MMVSGPLHAQSTFQSIECECNFNAWTLCVVRLDRRFRRACAPIGTCLVKLPYSLGDIARLLAEAVERAFKCTGVRVWALAMVTYAYFCSYPIGL